MKRQLFAIGLSFGMLTQASVVAAFDDVTYQTSYADAIYWTYNEGITEGYGDGNWGPDNCVRRAELLKMILEYHYPNEDIVRMVPEGFQNSFSDVSVKDWFFYYVMLAKSQNIVEGYSDATFRPYDCVNRVEAMKMVVNTLIPNEVLSSSEGPLRYWGPHGPEMVDMDRLAWYAPYARVLLEYSIVGTEHTQQAAPNFTQDELNFFPAEDMSRKEVAYMLYRMSVMFSEA